MAADYHPLRIRRTLPAAGHLLDLEARAAGRGCEVDPAAVTELVSQIGNLLSQGGRADPAHAASLAPEEALRLSKALQWARAGSRILSTPTDALPRKPGVGTLHVGGVELPSPCLFVAFDDPFPTPRTDLSIEGIYLGEGGRSDAVAAGWLEYVWALPIVVNNHAMSVGSAEFSPRCLLRTEDPSLLVRTSIMQSLAARREILAARGCERNGYSNDAWHETFADAIELALRAAAHSQARSASRPARKTRSNVAEASREPGLPDEAFVPGEVVLVEPAAGKDMAAYLLGPEPPRISHRWPIAGDGTPPAAPENGAVPRQPSGPRNGPDTVAGHNRGRHPRTYHAGTSRQYTIMIEEIRVNGGPGASLPREVKVTHLGAKPRRHPSSKERGGQVRQSMSIVSKEQA